MFKRFALLFSAVMLAIAPAFAAEIATPDDTARVLAGLPVSDTSPLAVYEKEAAWKSHAEHFNSAWDSLDKRQLSKVKAWSAKNVTDRKPVLYYMFSGPDFLYADAFFGGADTYIMAGLEPVGNVPDLTSLQPRALGQELRDLQNSLNTVLNLSFFITKKMKTELNSGHLTGTLPILYTFIARSGKTIKSVELVSLKPDGKLGPGGPAAEKGHSQGTKIEFTSGTDGKVQTLYYFSTDISNGGFQRTGFDKFLGGFGPGNGFVKSASYLMHSDSFSQVRDFLIQNTTTLVQDDSGIPVRYLEKTTEWSIKGYGQYLAPLSIFPGTYQQAMEPIYRRGVAEPIDFGVGYRWRPSETNLMLAVKGPPGTGRVATSSTKSSNQSNADDAARTDQGLTKKVNARSSKPKAPKKEDNMWPF